MQFKISPLYHLQFHCSCICRECAELEYKGIDYIVKSLAWIILGFTLLWELKRNKLSTKLINSRWHYKHPCQVSFTAAFLVHEGRNLAQQPVKLVQARSRRSCTRCVALRLHLSYFMHFAQPGIQWPCVPSKRPAQGLLLSGNLAHWCQDD